MRIQWPALILGLIAGGAFAVMGSQLVKGGRGGRPIARWATNTQ